MLFNSFSFAVFLVIALAASRLRLPWGWRKGLLLGLSYLFYAAWNPPFVLLLWLSTMADWFLARRIARAERRGVRRACLFGTLAVNLGLLGFFKYGGFALDNLHGLSGTLGFTFDAPVLSITLPIGISFYTFQTLSYTLDVYRGRTQPWPNFLDYALYVTFFPQLVAGPIVRSIDFLPQCREAKRATGRQLGWAMVLVVVGLFNKVVVADALMAPAVESVYGGVGPWGFVAAWGGTLAFAVQIFCDFAGYSTCAIGVALMLGFELPTNFRFPYAAVGFSDFWRRWHISLSTWLRDYLYIPLGGNRAGLLGESGNVMFTMLIGGLWHGASWNFVAWGGLHGLFLLAERLGRRALPTGGLWRGAGMKQIGIAVTFVCVCFAWVFFRAEDLATAVELCSAMLGANGLKAGFWDAFTYHTALRTLTVVGACVLLHQLMRGRSLGRVVGRLPWPVTSFVLAVMSALTFLGLFGEDRAFIYFQF